MSRNYKGKFYKCQEYDIYVLDYDTCPSSDIYGHHFRNRFKNENEFLEFAEFIIKIKEKMEGNGISRDRDKVSD